LVFALAVTLAVAAADGGSAEAALVIAAALAVSGAAHCLARPRGSLARRLWQVNVAAAGLLLGCLGVLAGLIGAALSTQCQDTCAAQPPRWYAYAVGAVALVVVVFIVTVAVVTWRALQRGRSGEAHWPRLVLLAPSGLALIVAATTGAQRSLLAPLPTAQGQAQVLAKVPCVEVNPARPCYSASNLTVTANQGELLVLWGDATSIRGALVTASGTQNVFIAEDPESNSEGSDAVAAAPLANGAFAVVWSDQQTAALHAAIVSSSGQMGSTTVLTGDGTVAAWPLAALAATDRHTLMLFVADQPQPSADNARVRLLTLDTDKQLRPQTPMRTLPIKYEDSSGFQADELPGGTVALQTGTTAQVFTRNGQLLATHPNTTVIYGPAAGRVVPLSELSTRINWYYSSLPTAATINSGKLRLLVENTDQPGFGQSDVSEEQVTGPGLPTGEWLAALNLNPAALVNSPDGLAVVGVRDTGSAKFGGGSNTEVVLVRVPNS